MGKDNIRYKTGLTDVAETYVDVINSSSDISQIGTQIMGMNFLHEQAINQNDPDALEILREATPHFRTILKGLESFVHSLETGKRTNTKDPWLAWIPIANIYLATQIAKVSGWFTLAILLPFIPVIGSIASIAILAWIWWKIAEIRKRPGWWGILIALIPIVNLVLIGILAWDKK